MQCDATDANFIYFNGMSTAVCGMISRLFLFVYYTIIYDILCAKLGFICASIECQSMYRPTQKAACDAGERTSLMRVLAEKAERT